MKRSEMVRKLCLPISIITMGYLTGKEIMETADSLLKTIENEGMAPPPTPDLSIHPESGFLYEWESETKLCPKHLLEISVGDSADLNAEECEKCK